MGRLVDDFRAERGHADYDLGPTWDKHFSKRLSRSLAHVKVDKILSLVKELSFDIIADEFIMSS